MTYLYILFVIFLILSSIKQSIVRGGILTKLKAALIVVVIGLLFMRLITGAAVFATTAKYLGCVFVVLAVFDLLIRIFIGVD